jgi:hypothetical protein
MPAHLKIAFILLSIFLLAACALAKPVYVTPASIPTLPFTPKLIPSSKARAAVSRAQPATGWCGTPARRRIKPM